MGSGRSGSSRRRRQVAAARRTLAWIAALGALCAATGAEAVSFGFTDTSLQVMASRNESFVRIPAESFEISNASGIAWNGFTLTLAAQAEMGPYAFIGFIDLEDPGTYQGPGTVAFFNLDGDGYGLTEVLSISGLNVADGGRLSFTADLFGGIEEGMVSYEILGRPSVDLAPDPPGGGQDGIGQTIPEPSALLLFSLGALTLVGRAERRLRA